MIAPMQNLVSRLGSLVARPHLWIALGLLATALMWDSPPRAPLQKSHLALFALMLLGLVARALSWKPVVLSPRATAVALVAMVWVLGMGYELGLTRDGNGVGGFHDETLPSFVIAQGDYLALAGLTLAAIRLLRLDFVDVFFFGAGIALTEGLIFTGSLWIVLTTAQVVFLPLLLGQLFLAYGLFLALPLLAVDPRPLYASQPRLDAGPWRLVVLGFVSGVLARIAAALIWGPVVWVFLTATGRTA